MGSRNLFSIVFFIFLFSTVAFSQKDQSLVKDGAPNVFIDCSSCNINYFKEQVPIVNYVVDRNDADIHILFSRQTTGSGGVETSLFYIGQKIFAGINDTIKYTTNQTDSEEQIRAKSVRAVKLGLARYIAKTSVSDQMNISYVKPQSKTGEQKDDWDFWLFRTSFSSFLNGQESAKYMSLYGSISASRVTEDMRLSFSISNSYNENVYNFGTTDYTSISRSSYFNASVIRAINDKWSWGLWAGATRSTYSNLNLNFSFSPGIEYNFFPYAESNRRQLRVNYKLSGLNNKYFEETIYFKTNETLFSQSLNTTLSLIEQWGTISFSVYGSNYLHDFKKYELGLSGSMSLKLVKGLSIDLFGSYSKIRNQITLPRGGASLEEVLLQRTQLETGYSYFASIGFSYSFGSIYNNIVNPRFGGGSSGISYSVSYSD